MSRKAASQGRCHEPPPEVFRHQPDGAVCECIGTLRAASTAVVRATTENELLYDMCRVAVDIGGYRLAWIGFVEHDETGGGSNRPFAVHTTMINDHRIGACHCVDPHLGWRSADVPHLASSSRANRRATGSRLWQSQKRARFPARLEVIRRMSAKLSGLRRGLLDLIFLLVPAERRGDADLGEDM
jgi:hypothetical protein